MIVEEHYEKAEFVVVVVGIAVAVVGGAVANGNVDEAYGVYGVPRCC